MPMGPDCEVMDTVPKSSPYKVRDGILRDASPLKKNLFSACDEPSSAKASPIHFGQKPPLLCYEDYHPWEVNKVWVTCSVVLVFL